MEDLNKFVENMKRELAEKEREFQIRMAQKGLTRRWMIIHMNRNNQIDTFYCNGPDKVTARNLFRKENRANSRWIMGVARII